MDNIFTFIWRGILDNLCVCACIVFVIIHIVSELMLCCAFMFSLWLVPISVVAVERSLSRSRHNVSHTHTHTHTYIPKRTRIRTSWHMKNRRLQRIQEISTYQNMRKNLSYSQFEIIYFIAISSLLSPDLLPSHSSASSYMYMWVSNCSISLVRLNFPYGNHIPILLLLRHD